MVQKLYKTDSWFQKSHKEFGQLQTSSGKSKKLKSDGLLLSKKYISSAKTLYTEDLSTLLSTVCSPNSQIPYVISETASNVSRHNPSEFF